MYYKLYNQIYNKMHKKTALLITHVYAHILLQFRGLRALCALHVTSIYHLHWNWGSFSSIVINTKLLFRDFAVLFKL